MTSECSESLLMQKISGKSSVSGLIRMTGLDRVRFADARDRSVLVAKARWLLLVLIALYGAGAGVLFSLSDYGFFLSISQLAVLAVSVAAVLCYNGLIHLRTDHLRKLPFIDHLQIVLDFSFVTLLIHFSGGGASWFWPVYLIVTLEAAILLEHPRDVWLLGFLSGALYGIMLLGEYYGWWPPVRMPFVDAALHRDGLHLTLMWLWVGMLNATVAVVGAFLMGVIRQENRELRTSRRKLSRFLEEANDLIFSLDSRGRLLFANRAWRQTLGHGLEALDALNIMDIVHPDFRHSCLREFRKAVAGETADTLEGRLVTRDGQAVEVEGSLTRNSDDNGDSDLIWVICRDITERKKAQAQLYHLAHHDMLTGLPNRHLFLDRLRHDMAMARRTKKKAAVLFLDLDRFKIINDTLGHTVGDKLLKQMGWRLQECVREIDTVARMGGDEFTIGLANLDQDAGAEKVAEKILKALSKPVRIDGHELFITTSIGISLFPDDGDDPLTLIKMADIAMYSAKAQGRNNYQLYQPTMDLDADKRLVLENGIRRALENDQFRVFYQPKVDIVSGRVTAMEALLRWEHPELGLLPPNDFIPLAEETGLIFPIGEWVLREACRQNRRWQDKGIPPVRVAVNISGYQLQQKNLTDKILTVLSETGLEARYLEIEVTETVVMQNPDAAVKILNEVKELGVHIAIDDFGTGYSSLAHLKRFSVNTLKIDKSFVRDVELNSTDAAIATAIIAMGNSLKLQVIAEGVETEGQLDFLKQQSCHEVQGFLFSRPLPAEDVEALLSRALPDRP